MTPAQIAHIMALLDQYVRACKGITNYENVMAAKAVRDKLEAALRDAPQQAEQSAPQADALYFDAAMPPVVLRPLGEPPSAPTAVEPPYPMATTLEGAAQDVAKWLNERPNSPLDFRHVAMLVHAVQASATAVKPDERAMFEAWYFDKYMLQPEKFGDRYDCQIANQQWIAWQARASKGTPL